MSHSQSSLSLAAVLASVSAADATAATNEVVLHRLLKEAFTGKKAPNVAALKHVSIFCYYITLGCVEQSQRGSVYGIIHASVFALFFFAFLFRRRVSRKLSAIHSMEVLSSTSFANHQSRCGSTPICKNKWIRPLPASPRPPKAS